MTSAAGRVPRPRTFATLRVRELGRSAPHIALGCLLMSAAALILTLTAGDTFYRDEWFFVAYRNGASITNLFAPHIGHLYVGQVLTYLLFFDRFGLDDYTPFRIFMVLVDLGLGVLVFAYCRRRVGPWIALFPAAIILFFGPGSDDVLWPFQAGFIMPLVAGIGALLALDDDRKPADRVVCCCLFVALCSSGISLAVAAGLIVDWALRPRRRARLWVWAAPLSLWFAWYIWLGRLEPRLAGDLSQIPEYVYRVATATADGIVGIGAPAGQLLLVVLAFVLARQFLLRMGPTRQATVLLVTLLTFWGLLAAGSRAGAFPATSNRYLLPGAVLMLLLLCELARGSTFEGRAIALAAAVTAVILAANIGILARSAHNQRDSAERTSIVLGAIEIAGAQVPPDFDIDSFAGNRVGIPAGPYLAAVKRWDSSPALTEAQIGVASERRRTLADQVLQAGLPMTLNPGAVDAARLSFPEPTRATGGTVRRDGQCVVMTPSAGEMRLDVPYPPGGLALRVAAGATAAVSLRRFASQFPPPRFNTTGPSPSVLRIPRDRSRQPWFVRVSAAQPVRACGIES